MILVDVGQLFAYKRGGGIHSPDPRPWPKKGAGESPPAPPRHEQSTWQGSQLSMSMSIVHHVREKSQSKGSARVLLFDLTVDANDCYGVAWPSDTTPYHDVHVNRQRIPELK